MKKNLKGILAFFLWTMTYQLQAQGEPLRVAIESYAPPFVMQASKDSYYGFDIDLIEAICKRLDRKCSYQVMRFEDLLPAVSAGSVDVALSGITLTLDRLKQVDFSLPYLLSRSRFMSRKENAKKHFTLLDVHDARLGVQTGSIFVKQLASLGINNSNVKYFQDVQDLVNALSQSSVDYILLDNPSAVFWHEQASDNLALQGRPMPYGMGYAIAIQLGNKSLRQAINRALLAHEKTKDYKESFEKYLSHLVNEPSEVFRPR